MASSTSSSNEALAFATLIHMLTIKLNSTNYLLWHNQVTSLLTCQDLLGYIDGTISQPSSLLVSDGKSFPNPAFESWNKTDQKLKSLLLSSLSEETMAVTIGCRTSREVWLSLESFFSHDSKSR